MVKQGGIASTYSRIRLVACSILIQGIFIVMLYSCWSSPPRRVGFLLSFRGLDHSKRRWVAISHWMVDWFTHGFRSHSAFGGSAKRSIGAGVFIDQESRLRYQRRDHSRPSFSPKHIRLYIRYTTWPLRFAGKYAIYAPKDQILWPFRRLVVPICVIFICCTYPSNQAYSAMLQESRYLGLTQFATEEQPLDDLQLSSMIDAAQRPRQPITCTFRLI
jgi:hypothetical protein